MFVVSYIGIFLLGWLIIQFLSNGFFSKFMKVKASRGKLTLVKVHGISDTYYRAGHINETELRFKDRQKKSRMITVGRGDTYRAIGVNCIDIEDSKNCITRPDGETVAGFDAVKIDNLMVRCLTKPNITNKKDQMKIALLFILILGAVAIVGYLVYTQTAEVKILQSAVKELVKVGNV